MTTETTQPTHSETPMSVARFEQLARRCRLLSVEYENSKLARRKRISPIIKRVQRALIDRVGLDGVASGGEQTKLRILADTLYRQVHIERKLSLALQTADDMAWLMLELGEED